MREFGGLLRKDGARDWRGLGLALVVGSMLLSPVTTPAAGAQSSSGLSMQGPEVLRTSEAEYLAHMKAEFPDFFDPERYSATPSLLRVHVAGAGWVERPLVPLRDVPEEVALLFNAVLFQLSDKAYYQPYTVKRLLEGVVGFEAEVRRRLANLAPIRMYIEQSFSAGQVLAGLVRDNPEGVKENLAMALYKALYGSGEEARRFAERARRTGLRDEEDFLLAAKVYETLGDKAAARAILAERPGSRP